MYTFSIWLREKLRKALCDKDLLGFGMFPDTFAVRKEQGEQRKRVQKVYKGNGSRMLLLT